MGTTRGELEMLGRGKGREGVHVYYAHAFPDHKGESVGERISMHATTAVFMLVCYCCYTI